MGVVVGYRDAVYLRELLKSPACAVKIFYPLNALLKVGAREHSRSDNGERIIYVVLTGN